MKTMFLNAIVLAVTSFAGLGLAAPTKATSPASASCCGTVCCDKCPTCCTDCCGKDCCGDTCCGACPACCTK